jgi:hypothetical protein
MQNKAILKFIAETSRSFYVMKFFLNLFFFSFIFLRINAQTPVYTTSCIFNDTLWYTNSEGFFSVDLSDEENYEPQPVIRKPLRDAYLVFKSESYLWLIAYNQLLRYDGKQVAEFEFSVENIARIGKYIPISDDTLFFSLTLEKPEYRIDRNTPIAFKSLGWSKGAFFPYPEPVKKQQHQNTAGTTFSVYPYHVDIKTRKGTTKTIEMSNNLYRNLKSWLAPDEKLWVYQQKVGFSILSEDQIVEEIPFSFTNGDTRIFRLFFLENGKIAAFSPNRYAVYAEKSWFEFEMQPCLEFQQHKNTLFFIRQNEFSFHTLN